jgi:putative endonuclease
MYNDKHNKNIGFIGEKIAYNYYVNIGYKIKDKNVFLRGGEIDIIAEKDNTLYFVEVKTVIEGKINAIDNFTDRKAKNMKRAIEIYLYKHKVSTNIQIDLVCITLKNTNNIGFNTEKQCEEYKSEQDYKIELIQNIILE